MTILRAFNDFPNEAALIGRMLAGYADLEIDLMNCAKVVRDDLDLALKTMFRGRGNAQRIDVAEALARQPYHELGIGADFERAIGAVKFCLKIRNLYAHCTWWNDNSGQLAFANLEDLAKQNVPVHDLHGLNVRHVNMPHLESQFDYFEYADNLLVGIIQESNRRQGKIVHSGVSIPTPMTTPDLFLTS
jgi:hypothetical protein